MDRKEMVLAALAPAKGAHHSPVQVQKLLFLIDRNVAHLVGGPYFHFEPYHYGPFDKTVYDVLQELAVDGRVDVTLDWTYRLYRLTVVGQSEGERLLQQLPVAAQVYIGHLSEFVRSLSFSALVRAVYRAYPEMRANSVFQG